MQERQIWSLDSEGPLEKEMATHSIVIAGKSHGQRSLVEPVHGGVLVEPVHGVTKSQTLLSDWACKIRYIFLDGAVYPKLSGVTSLSILEPCKGQWTWFDSRGTAHCWAEPRCLVLSQFLEKHRCSENSLHASTDTWPSGEWTGCLL